MLPLRPRSFEGFCSEFSTFPGRIVQTIRALDPICASAHASGALAGQHIQGNQTPPSSVVWAVIPSTENPKCLTNTHRKPRPSIAPAWTPTATCAPIRLRLLFSKCKSRPALAQARWLRASLSSSPCLPLPSMRPAMALHPHRPLHPRSTSTTPHPQPLLSSPTHLPQLLSNRQPPKLSLRMLPHQKPQHLTQPLLRHPLPLRRSRNAAAPVLTNAMGGHLSVSAHAFMGDLLC